MLAILEQLIVVQDRDHRIAQLKAEQVRIPREIAATDQRAKDEVSRLEAIRQELKHIESQRKALEVEADSKRVQINKYQGQLSLIKSNTEYQALLKEIRKTEEDIRRIEDVELELMEKTDKLQPALKEEQDAVKRVTANGESEKAELTRRLSLIATELTSLQTERTALVATVDESALARYDRLLRSKGDLAIVPVKHGNCGGCHLQLPPQVLHNAKNGEELASCDYCGRILYWQSE
jgi:predicted  nucleic acid-binding Zn-ribbon protein